MHVTRTIADARRLLRERPLVVVLGLGVGLPLVVWNLQGVIMWWRLLELGVPSLDWQNYQAAVDRWLNGESIYGSTYSGYQYSPMLLPVFAALAPLGEAGWRVFHLLVPLAMPNRWLTAATLLAWPFWLDVAAGNVMAFLLLAAVWALRGSAFGGWSWLVATVLIPRPLMLPLAAWLLWKRPAWRLPFVAVLVAHLAVVAALGLLGPWAEAMLRVSRELDMDRNLSPSLYIGTWWVIVALPLAALLWRARRPLLAGLALQPYLLGYYYLLAIADLFGPGRETDPRG